MRHALLDTSLQTSSQTALGKIDLAESAGRGTGKVGKHIFADTFVTPAVYNIVFYLAEALALASLSFIIQSNTTDHRIS